LLHVQTPLQRLLQQLFRATHSGCIGDRGGGVLGGERLEGRREGGAGGGHDGPGGKELLAEDSELLLEGLNSTAGVFVDDGLVFNLGKQGWKWGGREGGKEGKQ